jgi:hypothetical protein
VENLRTYYYQDKREYSVSAQAEAGKVVIVDASHPTSVNVNKEFAWYVVGHVEVASITNPGVAYAYHDGPADNIVLVKTDGSEVTLPKGYAAVIYYKATKDPCTNIDSRNVLRGAKFPAAGTYTIWLLSGYVSADEAAMGKLSLGGLYELLTPHIKYFTGAPVTVTTISKLAPTIAPLALGTLLLLVK